jgi:glycosyltransferase involved in cell wall biosynthesis
MLALGERLPHDRFQVDFLSMSGAGPYDDRARHAGAHVRHLGTLPSVADSRLKRMAGRVSKTIRYARVARAERYDIIDAWLYPVDVMAVLARSITRTPVVVTGRYNLRDFARPMTLPERRANALANRFVDAVVANSEAVAEDTRRHETISAAKLRVIRNGVDPIEPLAAEDGVGLRRSLGVADGELLIGCVANYSEVKRHDLLIDAVVAIRRSGRPVRLLLVGEGPMRGTLERRITELDLGSVVRLHGSVPDPRALFSVFDVVAQTSRSEGLPNALLEAAAAGRPIMATAAGGSGEIVVDGETGLLVPVNDLGAITAAIDRLVQDAELRARLGMAAKRRASTEFAMSRFVGQYAALYEELAAAKGLIK